MARATATLGATEYVHVFARSFGKHPCHYKAIGGNIVLAHGADARIPRSSWIAVGAAKHMDQRIARAFLFTLLAAGWITREDNRVHPLTLVEHRAAERTRLHDVQRGSAAAVGHVVCQRRVVGCAQPEQTPHENRDENDE